MNDLIGYRGPDGAGIFENDQVTFGHRRLAIIDTSPDGAQPRVTPDGALAITYNGELYNYRELKQELSGYPFQSQTDTEVILAAYATWGIECLKKFNGIFAFALFDTRKNQLFLVRDPLGVKPLYYATREDGTLLFSSEVKALFAAGIPNRLNQNSFARYLHLSDVPGPETLSKGITKLSPGHYLSIEKGVSTLIEYAQLPTGPLEHRSEEEWVERIRNTFDEAVVRQLVSDRQVGMFLSGGIDSNAVLATMTKHQGKVRTYTTRFDTHSSSREELNRDADLARRTAEHFGALHTEISIGPDEVRELLEDATWHLDEPSGSATALSQLAIARRASRDVAVVLGGDGGDELFGGYERYQNKWLRAADNLGGIPGITGLAGPALFERFHYAKDLAGLLTPEWHNSASAHAYARSLFEGSGQSPLAALMNADLATLADGSLLRTDKLSMAAGLEARVPILDKALVELASFIPAHTKVGSRVTTKRLFKEAMRDRLPAYLYDEPKRGWFAPSGTWLRDPKFKEYFLSVLSPDYYLPTRAIFNWPGIQDLFESHYEGREVNRSRLWTLLSFQIWARRFQVTLY